MANKTFCDVCNSEVKQLELPAQFIIAKKSFEGKELNPIVQPIKIDLCERCGVKVETNIDNLKRKEI